MKVDIDEVDIKALQEAVEFIHPDGHPNEYMSKQQYQYAAKVAGNVNEVITKLTEAMETSKRITIQFI